MNSTQIIFLTRLTDKCLQRWIENTPFNYIQVKLIDSMTVHYDNRICIGQS